MAPSTINLALAAAASLFDALRLPSASLPRVDPSPAFTPLLAAQVFARQAHGAEGDQPLFLAPDGAHPANVRLINNWLARVCRETGLRFDRTAGRNRYTAPGWATFRRLATVELVVR